MPSDDAHGPSASRGESVHDREDRLVDAILGLPLEAQLGVLRTVAPRILARMESGPRQGFWRALDDEVRRAVLGERSYDIRHGIH